MSWVEDARKANIERIFIDEDANKWFECDLSHCHSIYDAAYEFKDCILMNASEPFDYCICKGVYKNELLTDKTDLFEGMKMDLRPWYVEFLYEFDENHDTRNEIKVLLYEHNKDGNYEIKWRTVLTTLMPENIWNTRLSKLYRFYNDMVFGRSIDTRSLAKVTYGPVTFVTPEN